MYDLLRLLDSILPNLDETMGIIGVLILIFGIVNAFFGYRLFKVMLAILGFFVGAFIGFFLFLCGGSGDSSEMIPWLVIGGLIGSVVAELFHVLGVFLAVGAMCTLVAYMMVQNPGPSLVIGIIGGIVGVIIDKYVIIISTALSGGSLAATGVGFIRLASGKDTSVQVLGLIIGICGIVFQLWKEVRSNADGKTSSGEEPDDQISSVTLKEETNSPPSADADNRFREDK